MAGIPMELPSGELKTEGGLVVPYTHTRRFDLWNNLISRYELDQDMGYMRCVIRAQQDDEYDIEMVKVEPAWQNQGIGRLLLQLALTEATEMDMRQMTATILNEPCKNAMRSVFGDDVFVGKRGTNVVWLDYKLK